MWKRMILLSLILFSLCLCQKNAECGMQNAKFLEETAVLGFADHLFDQEDYYRAIGEYQRFIFISEQDNELNQKARFRVGLCYQRSKQLSAALKYFKRLEIELPKRIEPIRFEMARTYYLKGEFGQAIATFQSLTTSHLSDYSQYMLGWCYLKQMDWTKAGAAFGQVKSESSVYTFSQELSEIASKGANLPHKSPLTVGIMSLLFPGSGQAYLHRFGDGTFSMLFTLGTIYLGHHYLQQGDKAAGNILSGLGYMFYGGNVYGAAASAKLINASSGSNYLEQIDRLDKERGVTIECWK
ncbi:tetratricopeptide repeat protein [Candidatus Desantisbacteria bacterium]|nr:tetratricopeptide repeat protein [Candidatus Desantisbacteria bacterium]